MAPRALTIIACVALGFGAACVERGGARYEQGSVPVEGAELGELVSDATFEGFFVDTGQPWIEHFTDDGRAATKLHKDEHQGEWWLADAARLCVRYPDVHPLQGRCFNVRRSPDAILFYYLAADGPGLYKVASATYRGNPRGLPLAEPVQGSSSTSQ